MSRVHAVVSGGMVVNMLMADSWPGAIDVHDLDPRPAIGWSYDGTVFTPPAQAMQNEIVRYGLIARMTPVEFHAWVRAAERARSTDAPVAADRNALFAWERWNAMPMSVDLTSSDIQGLKGVWMALGMTEERATELLTPLVF